MTEIAEIILPTPEEMKERPIVLLRALEDLLKNYQAILDRGISFFDNMDVVSVSFTSNAVADTEDTVAHTLGKVPVGILVYNRDKAASPYDSGTAWTTTNIFLKTNVATTALKIFVF